MITILGASGFVGSALARYLEEKGEHVTRLDLPAFDLTSPETFTEIPENTDILIHSAGYVGSSSDDRILWETNVKSTYYLLEYLKSFCRPRVVIYLSSGAVYGMQPGAVTCESPLHPDNLYAVSKLLAERMFETSLDSGLVILRLFFPFGPGQRPPRLIPRLIQRVARGETVEINTGRGFPIINPIFIDELVVQADQIMHNPKRLYYNVGGMDNLSIRQIVETIARLLGKKPKFVVKDNITGNMICKPDLSASIQSTFEEQLAETVRRADYL